jgi:hypothetical protein
MLRLNEDVMSQNLPSLDTTVTAPGGAETEANAAAEAQRKRRQVQTHRLAWIILSTAFVLFMTICLSTSFGVYYFLYQSSVQMLAEVKVARGTVGLVSADLSEQFEFDVEAIARDDTVLTDAQSQSVVSFRDVDHDNAVVAAITLKNDSKLRVLRMTQPRFEWSKRGYQVVLGGIHGEFDVFVPQSLPRDVEMTFVLSNNALASINTGGRYTITLTDTSARLETREGQAVLIPASQEDSRQVTAGQTGVYDLGFGTITVSPGYKDLVTNSHFAEPVAQGNGENNTLMPVVEVWNCNDRTPDNIPGYFSWETFEGRTALHLFRGDGARTHGETACVQPFGPSAQVGRPVSDYDHLSLRTTFHIKSHSLDRCGIKGSECPLMLLVDYVDTNGESNQWFQGFYAKSGADVDYPFQCVSCFQEHKRINTGAWYTYETGNLFTVLPEDRKPASILNVRFYASGHEYDVYVSELLLLALPNPDEVVPVTAAE